MSLVRSHRLAATMMVGSAFMGTLESVFLRLLGPAASQGQVLLFRSGVQLLLVAMVGAWLTGSLGTVVRTQRFPSHLLRGSLAAVAWWCYFMSFRSLPLAQATTLTFSSQLFVLALVWPMLRERVTPAQMVATLAGFAGVLVAAGVWNAAAPDWRVLYGIANALLGAVMILITRSLSFTDRTETIMFYMALVVFLSSIPQCAVDWTPLDPRSAVLLLLMAVAGTLSTWLMVAAYRRAEASALAPYGYARLIFAAALGSWLFTDPIAASTVAGAALIVASNLGLLLFVAHTRKAAAS